MSAAKVCGLGVAWVSGAPRTPSRTQGFSRQALQGSLVRWTRRAASPHEASLGPSEPSGHRPGCRGSEAGAGPRRAPRQSAGAERCSRVSTSLRAPSLRRIQRAERLEEETRGGGWTGGAKDVRGISPEQPPLPGRDQNALGLWFLRRGVSFPHVSASLGTASQPQLEAAKNRGLVGPRGQERVSQGCHSLRRGLAASVRSRLCADRAPRGVLSPTRNRPAARLPNKPPSPLPETPPFRDPRPHSKLTSPGAPPPLGLSPGPLLAAALPYRETRGAEVHAGLCLAWPARSGAATGGAQRLSEEATPLGPPPPEPPPTPVSARRCQAFGGLSGGCGAPAPGAQIRGVGAEEAGQVLSGLCAPFSGQKRALCPLQPQLAPNLCTHLHTAPRNHQPPGMWE